MSQWWITGSGGRAARFKTSNCSLTSSVTAMNNRLKWESFVPTTNQSLWCTWMSTPQLSSNCLSNLAKYEQPERGHWYCYIIPFCRTTTYIESFFPSTTRKCNQLPKISSWPNPGIREFRNMQHRRRECIFFISISNYKCILAWHTLSQFLLVHNETMPQERSFPLPTEELLIQRRVTTLHLC